MLIVYLVSTASPSLLCASSSLCLPPSVLCTFLSQGAETALYAATVEGMSGGVYVSPYHGTLSYPHVFDYVSVYGGPRWASCTNAHDFCVHV